jgi:hypothetical protein
MPPAAAARTVAGDPVPIVVVGTPIAATPILAASQVNLLITNVALMEVAFNIPGAFRELTRGLANGNTMLLQARLDPRLRDPTAVR